MKFIQFEEKLLNFVRIPELGIYYCRFTLDWIFELLGGSLTNFGGQIHIDFCWFTAYHKIGTKGGGKRATAISNGPSGGKSSRANSDLEKLKL